MGKGEVLLLSLLVPVSGRASEDGPQVRDFVGGFDGLRAYGFVGGAFDLEPFAVGLEEGFVVSQFEDKVRDDRPEFGFQFDGGSFGVLDGVVKQGGGDDVGVETGLGDRMSDFENVVDVGFGDFPFPALRSVLDGGELSGSNNF